MNVCCPCCIYTKAKSLSPFAQHARVRPLKKPIHTRKRRCHAHALVTKSTVAPTAGPHPIYSTLAIRISATTSHILHYADCPKKPRLPNASADSLISQCSLQSSHHRVVHLHVVLETLNCFFDLLTCLFRCQYKRNITAHSSGALLAYLGIQGKGNSKVTH